MGTHFNNTGDGYIQEGIAVKVRDGCLKVSIQSTITDWYFRGLIQVAPSEDLLTPYGSRCYTWSLI